MSAETSRNDGDLLPSQKAIREEICHHRNTVSRCMVTGVGVLPVFGVLPDAFSQSADKTKAMTLAILRMILDGAPGRRSKPVQPKNKH